MLVVYAFLVEADQRLASNDCEAYGFALNIILILMYLVLIYMPKSKTETLYIIVNIKYKHREV